MSTWDFNKESTDQASGNTVAYPEAGLLSGKQPFFSADTLQSKRNVIATSAGWVRRTIKTTDGSSTPRVFDEVLVAAHPGGSLNGGYSNSEYLGFPDVAQAYIANSTGGTTYGEGSKGRVYVVFNEPVYFSGLSSNLTLTVANTTASGNSTVALCLPLNSNTSIINANNTLVFEFTTPANGVYHVPSQTIGALAANLVSWNFGNESANLTITGAVSNTLGTFTVAS